MFLFQSISSRDAANITRRRRRSSYCPERGLIDLFGSEQLSPQARCLATSRMPMSPGFYPLGFTPRALEIVAKSAGFTLISLRSVSMGNRDYHSWFYDGLLRRIPLSEIGLKTLVRYWGPITLDNFGNESGRGHWLVSVGRPKSTPFLYKCG